MCWIIILGIGISVIGLVLLVWVSVLKTFHLKCSASGDIFTSKSSRVWPTNNIMKTTNGASTKNLSSIKSKQSSNKKKSYLNTVFSNPLQAHLTITLSKHIKEKTNTITCQSSILWSSLSTYSWIIKIDLAEETLQYMFQHLRCRCKEHISYISNKA